MLLIMHRNFESLQLRQTSEDTIHFVLDWCLPHDWTSLLLWKVYAHQRKGLVAWSEVSAAQKKTIRVKLLYYCPFHLNLNQERESNFFSMRHGKIFLVPKTQKLHKFKFERNRKCLTWVHGFFPNLTICSLQKRQHSQFVLTSFPFYNFVYDILETCHASKFLGN